MKIVLDIETDALDIDNVNNIWCIVCKDIDTKKVHIFKGITEEFKIFISDCISVIGHNICMYDYRVIERFAPGLLDPKVILDTLVLSKLLKYNLDDGEGHSLEAWGNRFKMPKHPSPDFSVYSDEMLEYCKRMSRLMQSSTSTYVSICITIPGIRLSRQRCRWHGYVSTCISTGSSMIKRQQTNYSLICSYDYKYLMTQSLYRITSYSSGKSILGSQSMVRSVVLPSLVTGIITFFCILVVLLATFALRNLIQGRIFS